MQKALDLGASYYMVKPFDMDALTQRIRQLMQEQKPLLKAVAPITANTAVYDLETKVTNILHEIGVPAHIRGYHYMREAIIMSVNDMDVLNYITKELYPSIAKNATPRPAVWNAPFAMRLRLHGTAGRWMRLMRCSATQSITIRASRPIRNLLH